MSIASELQRIQNAKKTLAEKAVEMGLSYGDETGAHDVSLNADGTPKDKIEDIAEAFDLIPMKTSDDLDEASGVVEVPAGYYRNGATKEIPKISLEGPTISIDANGKITAEINQSEGGYVNAGEQCSSSKQMTTKAAGTITPTKSEQVAVDKNVYTTGQVKVAPIPAQYVDTTNITKDSDDLSVSGATVTVPAGYYPNGASGSVESAGTSVVSINPLAESSKESNVNAFVGVIKVTITSDLENALAAI